MREQLAASLGPVQFSDIRAHLARDGVIVVDASLDLLAVAEAVARDDEASITGWIEKKLLGKPTLAQIEAWSKVEGAGFTAVVVQPYVLVREGLTDGAAS